MKEKVCLAHNHLHSFSYGQKKQFRKRTMENIIFSYKIYTSTLRFISQFKGNKLFWFSHEEDQGIPRPLPRSYLVIESIETLGLGPVSKIGRFSVSGDRPDRGSPYNTSTTTDLIKTRFFFTIWKKEKLGVK